MVAMISTLIERGNAYAAEGHVLFSVPSDPEYGILSRRDRRRGDSKHAHILKVKSLIPLGDHRWLDPFGIRCGDDLVVNVGDVAGIGQAI